MLGASLYFIDQEKKEAEARLYETAEYVKVQSSSVTHYNEALESQSLLRLIESVRQVGTNLKAEKETGRSTEEALLQQNIRGPWLSGILILDEKERQRSRSPRCLLQKRRSQASYPEMS